MLYISFITLTKRWTLKQLRCKNVVTLVSFSSFFRPHEERTYCSAIHVFLTSKLKVPSVELFPQLDHYMSCWPQLYLLFIFLSVRFLLYLFHGNVLSVCIVIVLLYPLLGNSKVFKSIKVKEGRITRNLGQLY